MKSLILTAIALSLPCVSVSQTLCRPGEKDYFSCRTTTSGKIVSVCGNIASGRIDEDSWLQYRFGKIGAIELAYPAEMRGSIPKFEGNWFNRLNVVDLRFTNGKALYSVALNETYGGAEAQKRDRPSGGVHVNLGKTRVVNTFCQRVNARKYYGIFGDLNSSLRAYNGETDFLYRYYNSESK